MDQQVRRNDKKAKDKMKASPDRLSRAKERDTVGDTITNNFIVKSHTYNVNPLWTDHKENRLYNNERWFNLNFTA